MSILTVTSEELVAAITDRRPSQCSCPRCQEMCQITPCLGTPQDIAKLFDAGYAEHLCHTLWCGGLTIGVPEIEMVQLRAVPGGGACPLFAAGRCTVHAIKPTSGRLAYHVPCSLAESPDTAVALTWLLPSNQALIAGLIDALLSGTAKKPASRERKA